MPGPPSRPAALGMASATAYAALSSDTPLQPITITRRELRDDDVAVTITHCGVCHSDLDAIRGHRGPTPLVPGHEFVGIVTAVGTSVSQLAPGDRVAVGNIVDSCGACDMCLAGQENYCREFPTLTYGGTDRHDRTTTQGGYATEYVVRERFAYALADGLDPAGVAPLMCAGITVWEPLRRWGVGAGTAVGVVGLGGLGHLAVKFAAALGAEVTVFTTTAAKASEALRLGASRAVISTRSDELAAERGGQDFILDTASGQHDLDPYLDALRLDGTLCVVGMSGQPRFDPLALLIGRKSLASAGSGGVPGTREMLDFCAERGITADVEVLPLTEVNTALERLRRGDVRYRFTLAVEQAMAAVPPRSNPSPVMRHHPNGPTGPTRG